MRRTWLKKCEMESLFVSSLFPRFSISNRQLVGLIVRYYWSFLKSVDEPLKEQSSVFTHEVDSSLSLWNIKSYVALRSFLKLGKNWGGNLGGREGLLNLAIELHYGKCRIQCFWGPYCRLKISISRSLLFQFWPFFFLICLLWVSQLCKNKKNTTLCIDQSCSIHIQAKKTHKQQLIELWFLFYGSLYF